MKIVIDQIDEKLLGIVKCFMANRGKGRVVNKFDKVINIEISSPSCLIAIAIDSVISSPCMMKTKDILSFVELRESIEIGDSVYFTPMGEMIIGNFRLDYTKAKKWDKHLSTLSAGCQCVESKYNNLKNYLGTYGKSGGIADAFLLHIEYLKRFQNQTVYDKYFLRLLKQLDNDLSFENIKQFLGLGVGLTPSGDDFVTGLLSVLYCYAPESSEVKKIFHSFKLNDFQNKTTIVSFYMIKNMLEGRVNEALYNYLMNETDNIFKRREAIEEILKIGSTSGTDMLVGVCFGLRYLLKSKRGERIENKSFY